VRAVFLDFTSAFNTIDPSRLIGILTTRKLNPNIINWTHSYLENRSQIVVTESGASAPLISSIGSPQGCVLSPLLFSIYVDDLRTRCPTMLTIKYADDTIVLENLDPTATSQMSAELDSIAGWCKDHNLIINLSKTKEIIFSNLRDEPTPPDLSVNGTPIERVDSYKYLGTVITSKLSFKSNIDQVVEKARRRLYIMSRLASLGVSETLRRMVYTTFIESVLAYHLSTTYHHLSANDKKVLSQVTRNASYLGRLDLPRLSETLEKILKKRVLTIYIDPNPVLEFDRLPSGRFRTQKCRTNLRKQSFRCVAIHILNKIFY
jgi:hypothetical protein